MEHINTHKKGPTSPQDQAFQNNNTSIAPIHSIRAATKKERAFLFLLHTPSGITENDVLFNCHLSSGRNYPNELERELNIELGRVNIPNPDGIGAHLKYWITCREDALKVANHINKMRVRRKDEPLSISEIDYLISQYPEVPEQAA